jgi:hypothetical protein
MPVFEAFRVVPSSVDPLYVAEIFVMVGVCFVSVVAVDVCCVEVAVDVCDDLELKPIANQMIVQNAIITMRAILTERLRGRLRHISSAIPKGATKIHIKAMNHALSRTESFFGDPGDLGSLGTNGAESAESFIFFAIPQC